MKSSKPKQELEHLLSLFNLSTFLTHYLDFARKADREKLDHIEYLYQLAVAEEQERSKRKTARLLKKAKLPHGKLLSDYKFERQPHIARSLIKELIAGTCLDMCENLIIFGEPGTGKSHLTLGLAREWCLQGRSVFYTTAAALVQDLLLAKRELALNAFIKKLDGFQALVIEDMSYIPQTRDETDVLFVLLSERYERRSVVVTSNLAFSDWHQVFKDPMTTAAAIDRLVHHSEILELAGPSFRADEAIEKSKKRTKKTDHQPADLTDTSKE
jgi:DNA replication protein DnaC